jgi:hypothetical protein
MIGPGLAWFTEKRAQATGALHSRIIENKIATANIAKMTRLFFIPSIQTGS